MISTKQWIFKKRPNGQYHPSETFEMRTVDIDVNQINVGQILVEVYFTSLDPAMRGWMNEARSYIEPMKLGSVMRSNCVGIVSFSKSNKFKVGEWVLVPCGWQTHAIVKESLAEKISVDKIIKPTDYLGALGLTGLTAYFGLLEIGKPKAGETIVVSGAAGATGSIVGQIAKIMGCRVIGLAGSDKKCAWLSEELGFDVALNYKDKEFQKNFRAATPKYVDVYFDNVGGEILEMNLKRLNKGGRVVLCGAISQYNTTSPKGPGGYINLIPQRGRMEGFIVFDYKERYPEAVGKLSGWIKEGKMKREDTIIQKFENAPEALLSLFSSSNNMGKMMVQFKEDCLKSNL